MLDNPAEVLLRGRWHITSTNDLSLLQEASALVVDIDASCVFSASARHELLSGAVSGRKRRCGSFRLLQVNEGDNSESAGSSLLVGSNNASLQVAGEVSFEQDVFQLDSIVGLPPPPALGTRVLRDLHSKRRTAHVVMEGRDSLVLRLLERGTFYELTRIPPGASPDPLAPAGSQQGGGGPSTVQAVLATQLVSFLASTIFDGLVRQASKQTGRRADGRAANE